MADRLEEWFHGGACDGFVIAATHVPGAYEDFVRLVVPELQRRGVFRTEYTGATLRENLGLPRAARGDWRTAGTAGVTRRSASPTRSRSSARSRPMRPSHGAG